jgi:hypothetical protein
MLFCACPVMTIRIMGAFKTHLMQYCGPDRTPPGVVRLSSVWQRIYDTGHQDHVPEILWPNLLCYLERPSVVDQGDAVLGRGIDCRDVLT